MSVKSLQKAKPTKLRKAFVLVRCSKSRHTNCKPMQNALNKSSKNILHSSTTKAKLEGTRYCVAVKAIVKENEIKKFESDLWKVKTRTANPSHVAKLKLLIRQ